MVIEQMVKAVLFDLDGTLLDRDTSVEQFISVQYDRLIDDLSHKDLCKNNLNN
jgi:putative hydrolase of the HAD superfamily